ncbi:M48 family metallopeptidase [Echinicola vietnamensis]|uniref:Peptidase family M48 n=1 Tax=Echinicola vietnamensis (strain DSM 17526 / LMG 23754 / KMM 6221) TaxID=926556 RepID=L0FX18_ECHVK|nr:M48 family metallopeptidase [Echinicola vietnamensis]AGA77306.1 Peptidase family M48 [Echinicola vietnamensis DSM 17526]
MVKKVYLQGFAVLGSFLLGWFMLAQVDWLSLFNWESSSDQLEEKLGEELWKVYSREADEVTNDTLVLAMDSILTAVYEANQLDVENIKLRILDKDEVNAFAMPDGYLVLYTGLIRNVDKQEELTGVICHEIAHIEENHVMKKLAKEVGISMLVSLTTGSSGAGVAEVAKLLSSSAFDRDQERAADLKAAEYMENAQIDPEHLANFLFKMSLDDHEALSYLTWISTHPDSEARATTIVDNYQKNESERVNKPVLSDKTWQQIQQLLNHLKAK